MLSNHSSASSWGVVYFVLTLYQCFTAHPGVNISTLMLIAREVVEISFSYRWGKWSSEGLSNLTKSLANKCSSWELSPGFSDAKSLLANRNSRKNCPLSTVHFLAKLYTLYNFRCTFRCTLVHKDVFSDKLVPKFDFSNKLN